MVQHTIQAQAKNATHLSSELGVLGNSLPLLGCRLCHPSAFLGFWVCHPTCPTGAGGFGDAPVSGFGPIIFCGGLGFRSWSNVQHLLVGLGPWPCFVSVLRVLEPASPLRIPAPPPNHLCWGSDHTTYPSRSIFRNGPSLQILHRFLAPLLRPLSDPPLTRVQTCDSSMSTSSVNNFNRHEDIAKARPSTLLPYPSGPQHSATNQ